MTNDLLTDFDFYGSLREYTSVLIAGAATQALYNYVVYDNPLEKKISYGGLGFLFLSYTFFADALDSYSTIKTCTLDKTLGKRDCSNLIEKFTNVETGILCGSVFAITSIYLFYRTYQYYKSYQE